MTGVQTCALPIYTAIIHHTEQVYESTSNLKSNVKPRSPVCTPKRTMSNGITGCLYGEFGTDRSTLNHSPQTVTHRQQKMLLSAKSSPLPPKHTKNRQHTNSIGSTFSQQRDKQYNMNPQETQQQNPQLRIAHMPSGLSLEPVPHDTDSVR